MLGIVLRENSYDQHGAWRGSCMAKENARSLTTCAHPYVLSMIASRPLGGQGVDQPHAVRTAPARHQVIPAYSRKPAVRPRRNVVEVRSIVRSGTYRIEHRIQ